MRKTETVDAGARRTRKGSLGWRWMGRSETQSAGRLSCGCRSLLSDCDTAGDEKKIFLKKVLKCQRFSVKDAPAKISSADEFSSTAPIPDSDW